MKNDAIIRYDESPGSMPPCPPIPSPESQAEKLRELLLDIVDEKLAEIIVTALTEDVTDEEIPSAHAVWDLKEEVDQMSEYADEAAASAAAAASSAEDAETAQSAAEDAAAAAASSATAADDSADAAAESATAAGNSATAAAGSATAAAGSATSAAGSATAAAASATQAATAKTLAETAKTAAETAQAAAEAAVTSAAGSATGAAASETAAAGSATAAETAEEAAEAAQAAAERAQSSAEGAATAAEGSATAAQTAQTKAETAQTKAETAQAESEAIEARIMDTVPDAVADWLDDHVDPETGYVIDDSLSVQGAAADAKKTGDELAKLDDAFDVEEHPGSVNILNPAISETGCYYWTDGKHESSSYNSTGLMSVVPGEKIYFTRGNQTVAQGRSFFAARFLVAYGSDGTTVKDSEANVSGETGYTVPNNVSFVRISNSAYLNPENAAYTMVQKSSSLIDFVQYSAPYSTMVLKAECNNDEHINEIITERMQATKHTTGMIYEFDINSDNHELNDTNTLVEDMFGYSFQFDGRVTTFSGLTIGHGNGISYGGYVKITPTHFEYYLGSEANPRLSEAHNLTIADYISVRIDAKQRIKADFAIYTNGGVYTKTDQTWDARCGRLFVNSNGTNVLTGCTFAYMCRGWAEKLHLYGDSYFGVYTDKWTNYLTANNWNKCNVNAYPGRASAEALRVAKNVLNHSNPEMIVWCMGMNDGDDGGVVDASWKACVDELMEICTDRDIELILATIPNVPTVDNTAKNAYVRASGHRYIDFAAAVGAASGTTWFSGMLSNDGVHPAVQGAIALFNQAIADVPELMQ